MREVFTVITFAIGLKVLLKALAIVLNTALSVYHWVKVSRALITKPCLGDELITYTGVLGTFRLLWLFWS